MRSLRILLVALIACYALPASAQQWDQVNGSMQVKSGPTAPLVIIDQTASGQKIISLRANGTEVCYATATAFTCTGGFTFPTSCTGTYTGPFTNGVTSTGQCVNGTAVTTTTSTSLTSTVLGDFTESIRVSGAPDAANFGRVTFGTNNGNRYIQGNAGEFKWGDAFTDVRFLSASAVFGWSDVSLSRGAANRLDIATGDSLYLVSGGLGVGVTPPSAGEIQASGNLITAASIKWLSAGTLADIADARWRFQNSAGSAGFLLGGGTESVMRVRTRTDGGYATVDALAYQVSGVAGVSATCAAGVASMTVTNGIITAITCS